MNIVEKKRLNNIVQYVKKDKQVLALFLFGSVARGDNYKGSDIDVGIVLKDNFSAKDLTRLKIEYFNLYSDLDIHIFQQMPIYIKKRIIKEGKLLFCRDEDALYKIAFSVISEFSTFEYFYRDYLKEVANAG